MRMRSIPPPNPPLATTMTTTTTSLRRVILIIRHGLRTPWSDDMKCWNGYWENPKTGIWNCDLTAVMSPPSHLFVREVEVDPVRYVNGTAATRVGNDAMFLFEKRYNARRQRRLGWGGDNNDDNDD